MSVFLVVRCCLLGGLHTYVERGGRVGVRWVGGGCGVCVGVRKGFWKVGIWGEVVLVGG